MYGRGAVYRRDIRPADGGLSAISLVPLKNCLAFTVNDAQGDRFGRNARFAAATIAADTPDAAQDCQSTTRRSANKLNPKRLRLLSEDAFQFV